MILHKLLIFFTLFIFSSTIFADPAEIILFPHAEKAMNSPHLSDKGIAEANTLEAYIDSKQFKPDIVIANRTPHQRALGSIETCNPIAKSSQTSVQASFLESEYKQMIQTVLNNPTFQNKKIFICWDKRDLEGIKTLIKTEKNIDATPLKPEGYAAGYLFLFSSKTQLG
jgi:hypothetical protein